MKSVLLYGFSDQPIAAFLEQGERQELLQKYTQWLVERNAILVLEGAEQSVAIRPEAVSRVRIDTSTGVSYARREDSLGKVTVTFLPLHRGQAHQ